MAAASAIAPPGKPSPADRQTVLEQLPTPSMLLLDAGGTAFIHKKRMLRGETVASLMQRLGGTDREALHFPGQRPAGTATPSRNDGHRKAWPKR